MVKATRAQVKLLRYFAAAEASGLPADFVERGEERTFSSCVRHGWMREEPDRGWGLRRGSLTDAGRAALEEAKGDE